MPINTINNVKFKNYNTFLKILAGGIVKSKRPVSQAQKELNKQARMAMSTGELDKDELKRKSERDLRTLYVRFSNNAGPKNISDIYKLDKTIKIARVPRQGKAKARFKSGKSVRTFAMALSQSMTLLPSNYYNPLSRCLMKEFTQTGASRVQVDAGGQL